MKISLFIYLFLLLSAGAANAQDTADGIYHLSKIPPEGLELDKGWKFKAGDNPEWAQQDYYDKAWMSIDPTRELHYLPGVREAGIGWFRLKMQVDSSLLGETLSMVISTMGASEIYLNGQLLYQFGMVSRDYGEEETRFFTNHLSSLKLGRQTSQVIAVRYSFNKRNLYLKFTFARPVFRVVFKESNQAFDDHFKEDGFESTLRSIRVSFYLPLGFLLVFLFYSFRQQKEYLYSGIFCFCFFGAILMHKFAESETITVSLINYLLLATQVLYIAGSLSFIYGTYILYKQKRSWVYFVLVLYSLLIIPFYFVSYDWSGLFNLCFLAVINFEFFRLNLLAVRRRRPGALILFITSSLLVLTLLSLVWLDFMEKDKLSALLQSISFIIPGIGLSLFFAGEFARTGSALQARVTEVEHLSQKMFEKEKEKQQILGVQNETLEKQVTARTAELSQSLKDLKETQIQLIQREKMASLGELTAGIAHEIENPLNFVNNFSEVNIELAGELKTGLNNSALPIEERNNLVEIIDGITKNQEKINHHGKRADAIVKGMLLHSRSGTGQKEPANINAIADECLRLCYNAIRAKDKSFQANIQIDFDESIGKFPIILQDIVRVFVNLFNNAFYTINEKRKLNGERYEPTVSVTTKKLIDKIQIKVNDNGMGIPQKVLGKIYQPFFTTKPTGEGTGLGLSLSYDIITKEHGGTIKAETKEGEWATFIIELPLNEKEILK
jgi:signal transduction histidine kinase